MDYSEFQNRVNAACSIATCYSGDVIRWNNNTPVLGHCAIVSALAREIFGGTVCKAHYRDRERRGTHYFNIINDAKVDFTSAQFSEDVELSMPKPVDVQKMLRVPETRKRFEIIKKQICN